MNMNATLNKMPYYNTEIAKTVAGINGFASLSDEDIVNLSAKKANEEVSKSKTAKVQKALLPAAVATVVATDAIRRKGGASAKILQAISSLLAYGVLFKSIDIAANAIDKISSKGKKEPGSNSTSALKCIGAIGGGAAIFAGIEAAAKTGFSKLAKKFPHTIFEAAENFNKFDNVIANSNVAKGFNKFVSQPLKTVGKNFPKISGGLKKYAAPITLGAYILGSFVVADKMQNKKLESYYNNANDLFEMREEARVASFQLENAKQKYDDIFNKESYVADSTIVIDAADKGEDINEAAVETLNETFTEE